MVAEQVMSGESQKTNLEEQNLVGLEQTVSNKKAPYGCIQANDNFFAIIFQNNKNNYFESNCTIFI